MNMWALPIAPYLEERLEALCTFLGDWDVIALQEVYRRRNYIEIANAGHKAGLVHHHYFVQGVRGRVDVGVWVGVLASAVATVFAHPSVEPLYRLVSPFGGMCEALAKCCSRASPLLMSCMR